MFSMEQLSKAPLPMEVSPSGRTTSQSMGQEAKALSPIAVTCSGIVTVETKLQFINAASPICVTGAPSISAGISALVAAVSQEVMVMPPSVFSR